MEPTDNKENKRNPEDKITIHILYTSEDAKSFKLFPDTPLHKLFKKFVKATEQEENEDWEPYIFLTLDGHRIMPDLTPETAGLKNNDVIDFFDGPYAKKKK